MWNFQPLEAVYCGSETQFQVDENLTYSERTRELGPDPSCELLQQRVSAGTGQKSNVYSVRLNISSSVFMGADILFPD